MSSDHLNTTTTTTFVQADPSTFRAVVQRLTGATPPRAATTQTLPQTLPQRPTFKLHERRGFHQFGNLSPAQKHRTFTGGEMMMSSPVSTLDVYGRMSPQTPVEEEERAILEKGFYLHPSLGNTPRASEPELLVLFPLCSPKSNPGSSSS